MKTPIAAPCAEWAPLLAASHPDDLLSDQQVALEAHVASCPACAAARADYLAMDGLIRHLPVPAPLPGLPPALLQRWRREDERQVTALGSQIRNDDGAPTPVPVVGSRISTAARPHVTAARAIAAVLLVGVLVGSYFALFAHRGPGSDTGYPGGPTATPDYGPTVLPTGPQPHVGDWQLVPFPPGTPDRAAQIAAGFRGGAQIVAQPAVPGLLYACQLPLSDGGSARFWRSEDIGHSWTEITPSEPLTIQRNRNESCWFFVSAADQDTVFVSRRDHDALYSLDRGNHWETVSFPPGSEAWNVGPPQADHGTWYFRIIDVQPQIWVSSDHGAHWAEHDYPVRLPPYDPNNRDPGEFPFLRVSYADGGQLWQYQHVIWQTSDYGEHWRQFGRLGDAPCDIVTGSWDSGLLYCTFWSGMQEVRAYWRSADRGQTWRAIPPGPPVVRLPATPGADANPLTYLYTDQPLLLHDGSLLRLWPTAEGDHAAAFFALAPGANVWKQVSAPLEGALGACAYTPPTSGDTRNRPACAEALRASLTAGPNGTEMAFVRRQPYDDISEPMYVATIAWK